MLSLDYHIQLISFTLISLLFTYHTIIISFTLISLSFTNHTIIISFTLISLSFTYHTIIISFTLISISSTYIIIILFTLISLSSTYDIIIISLTLITVLNSKNASTNLSPTTVASMSGTREWNCPSASVYLACMSRTRLSRIELPAPPRSAVEESRWKWCIVWTSSSKSLHL